MVTRKLLNTAPMSPTLPVAGQVTASAVTTAIGQLTTLIPRPSDACIEKVPVALGVPRTDPSLMSVRPAGNVPLTTE